MRSLVILIGKVDTKFQYTQLQMIVSVSGTDVHWGRSPNPRLNKLTHYPKPYTKTAVQLWHL
jgi:hypothetical protein